jgi:hypothetical protein
MAAAGVKGSGDAYHVDEAVASDWPGRDDHVFKDARRRRFGRRVASTCQTTSDRRARAEVRRQTGGTQRPNSFLV